MSAAMDGWGAERYAEGTLPTRYGFSGQYAQAAEFGWLWFRARWYDPGLGRWAVFDRAQADSIVPVANQGVQAWDRYAYVNNNPVRYTDPSGHMAIRPLHDYDGQTPASPWLLDTLAKHNNDPITAPQYSTWRELVSGSPCTACHVTHETGRIPTNDQIDRNLVLYYRAQDNMSTTIHLAAYAAVSNLSSLAPPLDEFDIAHLEGLRVTGDFPAESNQQYLFREPSLSDTTGFARYDINGNALYRVDLQGLAHGNVVTPHLHAANWNINPATGQTFFNGWSSSVSTYDPGSIIFYLLFGN